MRSFFSLSPLNISHIIVVTIPPLDSLESKIKNLRTNYVDQIIIIMWTTRRTLDVVRRSATSFSRSRCYRKTDAFRNLSSHGNNAAGKGVPNYDVVFKGELGSLKEYSVVFTNRALNLMSVPFQRIMKDLNALLKYTYNADKVAIIPGSGTFGMEAVARQFATDEHVMVIRNGWFSFRWTEIFDMGGKQEHLIPKSHTVLMAQRVDDDEDGYMQYEPLPIEEVVKKIYKERPAVVFAPHIETSTGIILPDDYIKKTADAVHSVGGIFVLDCIASGTIWIDMKKLDVDVVISAPQKGWTGPCCAALVMMSNRAVKRMTNTKESSFSLSLTRWSAVMDAYEDGGFSYYTTMPTDALRDFHEATVEALRRGLPKLKNAQIELGLKARTLLDSRGLTSVAAPGFQAPCVLVYHSPPGMDNKSILTKFQEEGMQIAMGVPWRIGEPHDLFTFRMGLFGLDKLNDIDGTISTLRVGVDKVLGVEQIVTEEAQQFRKNYA